MNYDMDVDKIARENLGYLSGFEESLRKEGLSQKTINKHMDNAGFYLETIAYRLGANMVEGAEPAQVEEIFDYVLVYKSAFSKSSIKEIATSVRKFYRYALKEGLISKQQWRTLSDTFKEGMPEWLKHLDQLYYGNSPYDSWMDSFD